MRHADHIAMSSPFLVAWLNAVAPVNFFTVLVRSYTTLEHTKTANVISEHTKAFKGGIKN